MMYDLFLHVVDTAVYLAEGPLHGAVKLVEENGHLKRAILQLETEQTTIVCSMDLHWGQYRNFEVTSPTGTYRLENLTDANIGKEVLPNGYCFHSGYSKPQEQELKQEKVYESHALCEEMLRQQQRHVL